MYRIISNRISCIFSLLNECSPFFFLWRCGPTQARTRSFMRFLDHTERRTSVGRTHLVEWLAHRIDLYLTTHNTSMPPAGFEPTISAGERPQTYAFDCAASGTGAPLVRHWKELHSIPDEFDTNRILLLRKGHKRNWWFGFNWKDTNIRRPKEGKRDCLCIIIPRLQT